MKHLRMLGLAAIAALGLMAFVGAGTASATTLSTDAAGTVKYGVGTEIHSTLKSGTSAILETTEGTTIATCTTSTVRAAIGVATGVWVSGAINVLNFGGCSQVTVVVARGTLEITKGAGDAGTVVGKGSEVTLELFGVSCIYGTGTGTTLGTIAGGKESELAVNAVLPKISGGFLCPATGRWTATYIVTAPHALHFVN
jgi:hypothetical protein